VTKKNPDPAIDTKQLADMIPVPRKHKAGGFTDDNVRDILAAFRRGIGPKAIEDKLGMTNAGLYTRLGVWLLHSKVEIK